MPDTRPLAEKLRQADGRQLTALLAQLTLESYFSAFGAACQNQAQEGDVCVCQFLYQLPQGPERDGLLYRILVEPFEAMQVEDHEETEEEDNDDYT